MIANTQAKIGRSMKIRDKPSAPAPGGAGFALGRCADTLRRIGRHRLDLSARLQAIETLDDNAVSSLQAAGHHPVLPGRALGLHYAAHGLAVTPDYIDECIAIEVA